jgi:hypothetical protein
VVRTSGSVAEGAAMALTVKMMSSGDVMLTYLNLTTAVAAVRVSVRACRR